ncbi:MAG: T9SS type A sorting domain-containing protein [Bacteroidota bacterium]
MKKILIQLSLLLTAVSAFAQGPAPLDPPAPPSVRIARLTAATYFPEAAEYAISLEYSPAPQQILLLHVNAAPGPAHARLTDATGQLRQHLPALEVDRSYALAGLESGVYFLHLDTEDFLPAGGYRIVVP